MHGLARCLPPLSAVALLALVFGPGCTRHDFRRRADKDVEGIISQKNMFSAWEVKNWHVYPDPRSRYADNTNPDRPPYPPDDYAARLLSPNPQKPSKLSGTGRVDGEGYVAFLQQWDTENRTDESAGSIKPLPPPNLPEKRSAGGGPAEPSRTVTASAAQDAVEKTLPAGQPRMPFPAAGPVDRPAVRHALPSYYPAALRPAPVDRSAVQTAGGKPAPDAGEPATAKPSPVAPVVKPAGAVEFGPWVPVRPAMPGPVVADRGNGPLITELRTPGVMVVAGEIEENGRAVPAVAVVPVQLEGQSVAQPPEKLPAPQPLLDPKDKVPNPLGTPQVGQGPGEPVAAPGDAANDYLRALESPTPGYRLKLDQAIELGVLTAREFQDRREDVYLAALTITLDRFNFAAMPLFVEQAVRQSTGGALIHAGQAWNLTTTPSISKLFPTGALLTAQLANQVVIDLGSGKPTTAMSTATLNLMQPFLRGGGYAVTLEPLTQDERSLVYAMRSFARFRKLFFVSVAASNPNGYTNNPYGLAGLSVNLGRGIGQNLTAPSVGYLPLLSQLAVLNNQKKNVAALERLLRLYQAFREGGQFNDLQVGQVEVQLLNNRFSLLGSPASTNNSQSGIRGYLDTLDNFKLQLGLPLTTNIELDDEPLVPIRRQLTKFEDVYAQVQAIELAGAKYDRAEPVGGFRQRWLTLFTTSPLVQGTPFAKQITERWASWAPEKLNTDQVRARLTTVREERRKLLADRIDRELKKLPEPPAAVARRAALDAEIDLGEFELRVRDYEAQPWVRKVGKERDVAQDTAFAAVYNAFYQVVLEARNDRLADLYANWPKLPTLPVTGFDVLGSSLDDAYTAVVQAALSNRLDLMNARASVVDSWRQIAVTANALQGVFNVDYNLTSTTPADSKNPFAFASSRSTSSLTFNFQLPLVRRAERNAYRAALISYQRARRFLMAFEDNIANDVRSDVRELRTIAQLYRLQQRVIELQYAQVDSATAVLFAPPAPGTNTDAAAAAALTTQVLNAQANLVTAQNTLYQTWIAYLTSRMNFYLDLELMQLDDRGVWIDELYSRTRATNRPDAQQSGERLPAPAPAPAPVAAVPPRGGDGQGVRP
ncbi:TolC family protein [Frigoriglobus tundricola]|uniref:Outer membrane efflux protein n=1 Tax=Frigoriglobus tundricola TaxID=2774151 RepID=A0A6M5YKV2_9BACT|nr:TolC family protein [Frigoriglobus tundricola]QJW93632.1 hypothetical protein FTUN_1140 [Frigoriglobus tundricola]